MDYDGIVRKIFRIYSGHLHFNIFERVSLIRSYVQHIVFGFFPQTETLRVETWLTIIEMMIDNIFINENDCDAMK